MMSRTMSIEEVSNLSRSASENQTRKDIEINE
jgi:hypothetical protein